MRKKYPKDFHPLWLCKNRDGAGFMELVDENAVMVCGGYRCTGAEYGEIVKDFDIASFEISAFEVIFQTEDICQVHYMIETKVTNEENKDLEGVFHITTTWKRYSYCSAGYRGG